MVGQLRIHDDREEGWAQFIICVDIVKVEVRNMIYSQDSNLEPTALASNSGEEKVKYRVVMNLDPSDLHYLLLPLS